MITYAMPVLRRTLMSAFVTAAFTFMASGCIASTPSATAQSRGPSASAGNSVTPAKTANSESPAGSELPPNWPWRGVDMILGSSHGAQPSDIDDLVNHYGLNSVHLYLQLNKFAPRTNRSNSQALGQSLQWLDAMLARCEKYHLMAIVHLESFPKPGGGYYNQHKASFWEDPAAVNTIYPEVAALAKHIHQFGYGLVAYDIISEPVMHTSGGPVLPPGWDKIQDRIIETIRANDPGSWVVVKVTPWGGARGYAQASPVSFPRVVYSVHSYPPHVYTHQGIRGNPSGVAYPGKIGKRYWDKQTLEKFFAPVVTFQNRNHALIYIGEFSAVRWAPGAGQYLRDMVSIFDSHGWGWGYQGIGGWNGWDLRYDTSYAPGKPGKSAEVGYSSQRAQTLKALFQEGGG